MGERWLERTIYSRYVKLGLTLMGLTDLVMFGVVPGVLIFLTQIVWIPFWAAGVINGVGHYRGYRNWSTKDASTNIVPWGILIGGEELHNNHHAFVTSAKLLRRARMAKGQQRGNREAKKSKKAKPPTPVQASSSRAPAKGSAFIPGKPK